MSRRFYVNSIYSDTLDHARLKSELEKNTGLTYPGFSQRDVIIIDGDPDGSSLDACKQVLYSKYCEVLTTNEPEPGCAITLFYRHGRTDILAESIKATLLLNPYNTSVTVKTGKQYVFGIPLTRIQYDKALEFFCDSLIYISEKNWNNPAPISPENRVAEGFNHATYQELADFKEKHNLKIDIDDMMCIQNHFLSESRDPTFAEIAVIDRFFGEDFRHTTFETLLDQVKINDPLALEAFEKFKKRTKTKKTSLSGIAEASKRYQVEETLPNVDSKIRGIKVSAEEGEFLLTFVGESRNRSVSVCPYDGAAACLSEVHKGALSRLGSITDTYRVSGTSDEDETNKRAILASEGFNDYALAVGAPCTKSTHIISSSYRERQLEFCAALSVSKLNALNALWDKKPCPEDTVYLLGARTGRDGTVCFEDSNGMGEFVAVTNPGIMNSLKRLLLRDDTRELISSLVYVGSGGIICAIGKLKCGAIIHTEKIPAKHNGISVEELLLSESAERMILCVSPRDAKKFKDICHEENVPFAEIAEITDEDKIVVTSARSQKEVSIKTEFLLSGGTAKHRGATIETPPPLPKSIPLSHATAPFARVSKLKRLFSKKLRPDLKAAFTEACKYIRFSADSELSACDATVGCSLVTSPLSNKTPDASIRTLTYMGEQLTFKSKQPSSNIEPLYSVISFGANPAISRSNPFKGAYIAVTDALTKAVVSGFGYTRLHIATQEYLPEYKDSSKQYGMALASLLGVYAAQTAFKVSSLGGRSSPGRVGSQKENNSGIAVFAIGVGPIKNIITRDFKNPGSTVVLFKPETEQNSVPMIESQMDVFRTYDALLKEGKILSAISVNARSAASGIIEMCHASGLGFDFSLECPLKNVFDTFYGSIIAELDSSTMPPREAIILGHVTESPKITYQRRTFEVARLFEAADIKLHNYRSPELFSASSDGGDSYAYSPGEKSFIWSEIPKDSYGTKSPHSLNGIRVLIPVNNYYTVDVSDVKSVLETAGCTVDITAYSESTPAHLIRAVEKADIIYIPDCLGHTTFAKAFFKLSEIKNALDLFRKNGGLIYGEGNGFEVLLASGLLELDENRIGICENPDDRAVCHIGKVRASSLVSPIMRKSALGELYDTVISGKRLRISADSEYIRELAFEGRIASQFLPNDNILSCTSAIDAICSRDGRVLGRISRALRFENSSEFKALPVVDSLIGYFKPVKPQK